MTGMPSPLNDDSTLMFRLLADGEWHQYDAVKAKIAEKVPPGRAFRRYQNDIEAKRLQKGDPGYDTELSEDLRIEFGSKRIGQATISSWAGKGVIVQGIEGVKRVKLKPGFWPRGLSRPDVGVKNSSGDEDVRKNLSGEVISAPGPTPVEAPEKPAETAKQGVDPPGVPEVPERAADALETPLTTRERPRSREGRQKDFLTRALGQGVIGPIYGPDPGVFHTRPLASLSGPEDAIRELEEAVPAQYSRDAYLKAVEERFPQLVEPETESSGLGAPLLVPEPPSRVVTNLIRCMECAGLIEDEAAHLQWHEEFVKKSEQIDGELWNESRVRAAVRAEMAVILDRFQVSMQGYLEDQFAQLSGLVVHFRGAGRQWRDIDRSEPPKD